MAASQLPTPGPDRVAEVLHRVSGVGVLEDRRAPRPKADVEYVAVGPTGVFVIVAQHDEGKVVKRNVGRWLRSEERLYVDRRDRTPLLERLEDRTGMVRAVLDRSGLGSVPVRGVLCFVGARWPLFNSRPVHLRGAVALWPDALADCVGAPGGLGAAGIARTKDALAGILTPA